MYVHKNHIERFISYRLKHFQAVCGLSGGMPQPLQHFLQDNAVDFIILGNKNIQLLAGGYFLQGPHDFSGLILGLLEG
ncbi:hypothetical protein D1872_323320 [compost metagenome]